MSIEAQDCAAKTAIIVGAGHRSIIYASYAKHRPTDSASLGSPILTPCVAKRCRISTVSRTICASSHQMS